MVYNTLILTEDIFLNPIAASSSLRLVPEAPSASFPKGINADTGEHTAFFVGRWRKSDLEENKAIIINIQNKVY